MRGLWMSHRQRSADFWRIHLSSMLALTVFAGAVLGINLSPHTDNTTTENVQRFFEKVYPGASCRVVFWGWPFAYDDRLEVQFSEATDAYRWFTTIKPEGGRFSETSGTVSYAGQGRIASISGHRVTYQTSLTTGNGWRIVWNILIGLYSFAPPP